VEGARNDVAAMRRRLGPPVDEPFTRQAKRRGLPVVLAYAETLSPRPSDWNGNCHITGHVELSGTFDCHSRANGERTRPLDQSKPNDPPVFLGFGSMPIWIQPRPPRGARPSRRRARAAVVGAGWTSMGDANDERLQIVPSVDHAWLFPRCRAAVHHGGAGTTHASLGAGLPTLVCSVFADQPYWGVRVRELGVGAALPFPKLDERTLTKGFERCSIRHAGARPRALDRSSKKDGLASTIALLEEGRHTAHPV
jgi:sterol 3beta-glucosyltransferase